MKRFSAMTSEELHAEIAKLQEQKKHAEYPSQLAIIESKIFTAQSYLLPKEVFTPGFYHVVGHEQPMMLEYLNGVMAWGTIQGEEVSFPIAMLQHIQ